MRIIIIALSVFLCGPMPRANAQEYPNRTVRLIVPYPPGGVADIAARVIGNKLSEGWKQQVVVENRSGGGGIVGADAVAKAAPDGYTLLVATAGDFVVNPNLYSKLPYSVQRDLAPIVFATDNPIMWAAHASAPFTTIQEMIAYSKSAPGGLSFASPSNGSLNHLAAERFALETGAKLVHIPYKGGGPAGTAIAGGEVPVGILAVSSVVPHIRSGRIKAIGVAASKRVAAGPDWPTIAESGVAGFEASNWTAFAAPAATSKEIITKVNADVNRALAAVEVRERLIGAGSDPVGSTPEALAARIQRETAVHRRVAEAIGLRLD